jgi:inosine triphosphate pyrophosphatase
MKSQSVAILITLIIANPFTACLSFYISTAKKMRPSNMIIKASSSNDASFEQLKISFVTGNEMKAKELNLILSEEQGTKGPAPQTSLVDLKIVDVDLPEIQEVNTEAIAKNKAILGAQLANGPCVVEDTSLEFNALGGMVSGTINLLHNLYKLPIQSKLSFFQHKWNYLETKPGPYIKWFQQTLKSEGLYNLLTAYEDKSAVCVCTLAFCPVPHADPVLFTGKTHGKIVKPVQGRGGFGWDSIFVPDGEEVPFSMMSTEEKNKLSHRGKAVRKWAKWLGHNKVELWERQTGRPAIGHKGLDFKIENLEE